MDIYAVLSDRRKSLGIPKLTLATYLQMPTSDLKQAEEGNPKAHTLEKVSKWAEYLGLEIMIEENEFDIEQHKANHKKEDDPVLHAIWNLLPTELVLHHRDNTSVAASHAEESGADLDKFNVQINALHLLSMLNELEGHRAQNE